MTKQETFNIVVPHLRSMKAPSRQFDMCAYRGENGAKCAVGILIPDDMYDPAMEGRGCGEFFDVLEALGHDVSLCFDLQIAHDEHILDGKLEPFLRKIAKRHDLKVPAP